MKTSASDTANRLRALLHAKTKAATERTLADGAQVSELEELERLSRLVTLAEASEPVVKKRWPVAVALCITLLVVSLLLFARVPGTEIELDVITSEAEFTVPTQQVLTETMNVEALGVSGLAHIALPAAIAVPTPPSPAADQAVRIASIANAQSSGSVSLSALAVPAGTRVSVRVLEGGRRYRIGLRGGNLTLRVGLLGPTEISLAGAPTMQADFVAPRSVELTSGKDDVMIDLTLAEEAAAVFSPLLPVSELTLFRVDDYPDAEQSVVRRVSAIQSGTLFLESLNGQERRLRPGQALSFRRIDGEIRTLQLSAERAALQLHARVQGMKTGAGSTERSLMPTWLEWLYARHGVTLLWGTTLYIFGLAVAVLRWWRRAG